MDQGIAHLLVIAFAAASVISFLEMRSALKAPTCPECSHCRSVAYERRRHEEDLRESYARRHGFLDREDDDGPRSGTS